MSICGISTAINIGNVVAMGGFLLLVLVLAQPLNYIWRFFRLYGRNRPQNEAAPLPYAAVLLPVRGADPSLRDCLNGLLRQNYPQYMIVITIDSRTDAAWDMVQQILADNEQTSVPVQVEVLENVLTTCSLKLSAHVQALANLDQDCEVVVLVDADVVPSPTWLSSLVQPLSQPGVGASTGIRWYAPCTGSWGSLVRYIWNAVSFVYMCALGIPWGGSLAFRRTILNQANLPEVWAHSFCDDTSCIRPLYKLGLRLVFVPEATAFNTEAIGLVPCLRFIRRQLLNVRLYHPHWITIVATSLALCIALIGVPQLGTVLALKGDLIWSLALSATLFLYGLLSYTLLILIERRLRAQARGQGRKLPPFPLSWPIVVAVPLVHAVQLLCMISSLFLRRVDWRGVSYEISKERIRLLEPPSAYHQDALTEESLV